MATCDPKTLLASVSAFRGASERQIRLARIGSLCNVVFPPIAAPTAPSNLTATPNNTVPNVALGWTQGAGTITSVNLYRQVNGGGFSLYQTLGVVTAYTDTGVAYGNTYDYKVLDHGPGGDSPFSNTATAVVAMDSEVNDWADVRVPANGGTVSAGTKSAANTFMLAIKSAGLRSKILRLNLFAGNDFVHGASANMGAVQVPLIKDKGSALEGNGFATSTWSYAESGAGGGLQTSANSFLDTGFIPSTDFADINDCGASVYVRDGFNENSVAIGCQVSGSQQMQILVAFGDASSHGLIGQNDFNAGDSAGKGLYIVSRTASNLVVLYKNGSSIATTANPQGTFPTVSMYVFARHGGTPVVDFKSTKRFAGYAIHKGLSATDALNFYNAWQAFQTSLNRQV